MRLTLPAGTWNAVSVIRSGRKRRSSRKRPSGMPVTASTTRPATSVDIPYSHIVPGWRTSGALASASSCSAGVTPAHCTLALA